MANSRDMGMPDQGFGHGPKPRAEVSRRMNKTASNVSSRQQGADTPTFLEFFAGSGLVAEGLKGRFKSVWANDVCARKRGVYIANHGEDHFLLSSISDVRGGSLPKATLSWASFPCQDLSLAGVMDGIEAARSGLVWDWLRVMDEMPEKPPVLVAENVMGLVSAEGGAYYRALHEALRKRGYKAGAVVLNAVRWVPQSRPRVFVIAVKKDLDIKKFSDRGPNWMHPSPVVRAAVDLKDWIWWRMRMPGPRRTVLADIIEEDAPCDDTSVSARNMGLIAERHHKRLLQELTNGFKVAPGYKRTRGGRQVLELRFDGVAGCLRTPEGGSSRQLLVLRKPDGKLATRLLTVRETARLMGAPGKYKIPGSYNDGYKAMGDAVAVPVARHLAAHLLLPIAEACGAFHA